MAGYLSDSCAHCRGAVEPGKPIVVCPSCGAVLHEGCWRDHGGCSSCGWRESPEPTKRCPYCRELIHGEAVICKHCRSSLQAAPGSGQGQEGLVAAALRAGWRGFTSRAGLHVGIFLFGVAMVLLAVLLAYGLFGSYRYYPLRRGVGYFLRMAPGSALLFGLGVYLALQWLLVGLVKIHSALAAGQPATFGQLFSGGDRLLPFVGASLFTGLLADLAWDLWPGVGIAVMIFLVFVPYLVVAHGLGPLRAMNVSVQLVLNNFGSVLGFVVVGAVLIAVGVFLAGLGTIVTGPIVGIGTAHLCRNLLARWDG